MAEQRKATQSILLTKGSKTPLKIELFCATLWPDAPGARAGLLRVRVGGRWLCPAGKYSWFNAPGVAALLTGLVAGADPLAGGEAPRLPRGTWVRVPNGTELAGQRLTDRTRTATEPIQGADGRWYVAVSLYGRGIVHVPLDDVEVCG